MVLEEDDIREFIELWKEEFGEVLSTDEARYHASRFLELYALLANVPLEPQGESPDADSILSS
jgi:hypothetical protein